MLESILTLKNRNCFSELDGVAIYLDDISKKYLFVCRQTYVSVSVTCSFPMQSLQMFVKQIVTK